MKKMWWSWLLFVLWHTLFGTGTRWIWCALSPCTFCFATHTHALHRRSAKANESPNARASQAGRKDRRGANRLTCADEAKGERQPAQHPPTHQQTNTLTPNDPYCGLYVRSVMFLDFFKELSWNRTTEIQSNQLRHAPIIYQGKISVSSMCREFQGNLQVRLIYANKLYVL